MNTSTVSPNCTIFNLSAVIRTGDTFTARYEWTETTAVSYALPVYTNGAKSMTGKRAAVAGERKITTATKTAVHTEDIIIDDQAARELVELVKAYSIPYSFSRTQPDKWVMYIQEVKSQ